MLLHVYCSTPTVYAACVWVNMCAYMCVCIYMYAGRESARKKARDTDTNTQTEYTDKDIHRQTMHTDPDLDPDPGTHAFVNFMIPVGLVDNAVVEATSQDNLLLIQCKVVAQVIKP